MILELLWPREMKRLVKKFRAEGAINERVVKVFNVAYYFTLIGYGTIFAAYFLVYVDGLGNETAELIGNLVGFVLVLVIYQKALRPLYCNAVIPYSIGEVYQANVLEVDSDIGLHALLGKSWYIRYEIPALNMRVVTRRLGNELLSGGRFKVGEEITVLINPYNNKYSMPYMAEYIKILRLTTTPLKLETDSDDD
jgi:hypothetical protein